MKLAGPFLFSALLTIFFATDAHADAPLAGRNTSPKIIKLPQPVLNGKKSVEAALQERQSVRDYKEQPITLAEFSQLLWAAQGRNESGTRTAPSAGALYPLEVHAVVADVTGLSPGIYYYNAQKHEVSMMKEGDSRSELSKTALGQSPIKNAPLVLVISAVYERVTVKYRERGIRYVHMEAGHAAQNVYLQATALELGTVVIGAFQDEGVKKIMNLRRDEQPLYLMPVGKP